MKEYIILTLTLLIACQLPATHLTANEILEEFAKTDTKLGTNWHEEQIPEHMIKTDAIEPWTKEMIALKERTNDTVTEALVAARINMLKSQLAYYAMEKLGEQGRVTFIKEENKLKTAEIINCSDAKVIAKSLGLYNTAYKTWANFTLQMDKALQNDKSIREKIGMEDKKPKFYISQFPDALKIIDATTKAVYDQCQIEIVIRDKMEDPQSDAIPS